MTVSGVHEYYANGFRVSNCDAARYLAANVFAPDAEVPSLRSGRNPLAGFSGRRSGPARDRR